MRRRNARGKSHGPARIVAPLLSAKDQSIPAGLLEPNRGLVSPVDVQEAFLTLCTGTGREGVLHHRRCTLVELPSLPSRRQVRHRRSVGPLSPASASL